MLAFSFVAKADTFVYSYVGAGANAGDAFTINSPTQLGYSFTELTPTSASQLLDFGNSYGNITFVEFFSPIGLYLGNSNGYLGSFLSYDLTTAGTYTGDTGTLTVSPVGAAAAATPEPSSLALLGTGVLGVIGAARRRFMA